MNRAIGAVVVTIPAVSYILWPKPKNNHGHGHGGHNDHGGNEEHTEHSESEKTGEDSDGGEAQDEHTEGDESLESSGAGGDGGVGEEGGADESSGTAEDTGSDEKSSSEGEQEQDTPEFSDDEQSTTVSDVDEATGGHGEAQFKGPTKDGPPSDLRTSYSDSKGFKKKRIESNYGKPQGAVEGEDAFDYDSDGTTDKVSQKQSFAVCKGSLPLISGSLKVDHFSLSRPRLPSPLGAKTPCPVNKKEYPTQTRNIQPISKATRQHPRSLGVNPRQPN